MPLLYQPAVDGNWMRDPTTGRTPRTMSRAWSGKWKSTMVDNATQGGFIRGTTRTGRARTATPAYRTRVTVVSPRPVAIPPSGSRTWTARGSAVRDWQRPKLFALTSLLVIDIGAPTIDTTFQQHAGGGFRTASPMVLISDTAWSVYFGLGDRGA